MYYEESFESPKPFYFYKISNKIIEMVILTILVVPIWACFHEIKIVPRSNPNKLKKKFHVESRQY